MDTKRDKSTTLKDNINASVKKLCDIFVDSAQTTFGTYKNKRKNLNRKPKGDKPWFNYECKFARKNVYFYNAFQPPLLFV
jgi:hypothetical protein